MTRRHSLLAEDHVGGETEAVQMIAAIEQVELGGDAQLEALVELVASAHCQSQVVATGHLRRAEVEQVASLKGERPFASVERVVFPVQLNQREEMVLVQHVVTDVEVRVKDVGALAVNRDGVAGRVHEVEATAVRPPK